MCEEGKTVRGTWRKEGIRCEREEKGKEDVKKGRKEVEDIN